MGAVETRLQIVSDRENMKLPDDMTPDDVRQMFMEEINDSPMGVISHKLHARCDHRNLKLTKSGRSVELLCCDCETSMAVSFG